MFGWLKKKQPESNSDQKMVTVYLNPLHALLAGAERQKGSPLTEEEVLHVRDTCVSIQMTPEKARIFYASLDAQVDVGRMDPDRVWEEWQEIRDKLE
jgi:hypothetical protein